MPGIPTTAQGLDPAYLSEYNRVSSQGDARTFDQWLLGHVQETGDANPQARDYLGLPRVNQAPELPPVIQNAFDSSNADFNSAPTIPDGFFTAPPSLPPGVDAIVSNYLNPSSVQPSQYIPPTPAPGVVIAPTQETNNIISAVVNYFFPQSPTTINLPEASPAGSATGTLIPPLPGNDAAYGTVATPTKAAAGQVQDVSRSEPTGIPAQVAASIRGLNIPGLSSIKNDKALILATLAAPIVALALAWLVGKLFRRGN